MRAGRLPHTKADISLGGRQERIFKLGPVAMPLVKGLVKHLTACRVDHMPESHDGVVGTVGVASSAPPAAPSIGIFMGLTDPSREKLPHAALALVAASIRLVTASVVKTPRDSRRQNATCRESPVPVFFVIRFMVLLSHSSERATWARVWGTRAWGAMPCQVIYLSPDNPQISNHLGEVIPWPGRVVKGDTPLTCRC